jgi:UDP-N-acetylglucosamine acyltransferase
VNRFSGDSTIQIHPTAVIEEGARLGAGCIIHAHALITRHCVLAEGVVVHPFAAVGGDPQDLSFEAGRESGVRIGARTVIREHVTVNRATKAGTSTEVGEDCFLMTACHVAHDCRIGSRVVIANAVLMGGHVHVGERAFLGGGAVIHQGCRVGDGVMVGGGARISRDIAPFCLATERNALIGLNVVGLRRQGFKRDVISEIKRAFAAVDVPVGNLREIAASTLLQGGFTSPEARQFLEFFAGGRRGFVRSRRSGATDGGDGE